MRTLLITAALAALTGCDEPTPRPAEPPPPDKTGQAFDPARAGDIEGRVTWRGPTPDVPPFRSVEFVNELVVGPDNRSGLFPNPHAPRVNGGALAGALIELRGVDPREGRPWDLPPVTATVSGNRLSLRQWDLAGLIAVVRAGDEITLASSEKHIHTLQGRGAAHVGLALPAGSSRRWRFDKPGLVELRSGLGFFWMRGHVLVSEHPYAAVSAADGTFRLPRVPEGEYDLVVRHPSWRVESIERNVDNLRTSQVLFAPWLESAARVRVEAGKATKVPVTLGPG